ncbi:MAG: ribbon-helix-helix protein, CopG family [Akkermansia sp.]|nr:ribbon-helix-helix protein, CopG family [Akkermansia sp.]
MFHFRIPRETYHRLDKLSRTRGVSKSELVLGWVAMHVHDVVLTEEDYELIAKEIREAKRRKAR